ncbi:hypothetical protein Q5738_10585 [Citrobacter werkmanii]|uniref:hypothetical protein n=1 Tax=Citrobacter werkmanii TaxID=67827 RepID=UPI00271B2BDC|nr:hypothetical protein [Citrobacter werkmanii]MDO8234013.1 hypothetical protein [Citrobacter werkmanii]
MKDVKHWDVDEDYIVDVTNSITIFQRIQATDDELILASAAPELLETCLRLRNQLYAAGYESKEKSLNPTEELLYQTEQAINKALGK